MLGAAAAHEELLDLKHAARLLVTSAGMHMEESSLLKACYYVHACCCIWKRVVYLYQCSHEYQQTSFSMHGNIRYMLCVCGTFVKTTAVKQCMLHGNRVVY